MLISALNPFASYYIYPCYLKMLDFSRRKNAWDKTNRWRYSYSTSKWFNAVSGIFSPALWALLLLRYIGSKGA